MMMRKSPSQRMTRTWLASVGLMLGIVFAATTADAATVLEIDFDSLPVGAVSEATLDGATTGGTWNLNTGGNATHSIEDDTSAFSDLAFLSTAVSANQWGAQVVLDTPVDIDADLSSGDLQIDFVTATLNSTGFTRNARWRLYDGVTQLVEILMDDGVVFLNGNNLGAVSGAADGFRVRPWDSTSPNVFTVDIDIDAAGNVDLTFSDNDTTVMGSTTISSTADFDTIETRWDNIGGPMGVYLNNITVQTPSAPATPEPSSLVLATMGLIGLGTLRPRRRC